MVRAFVIIVACFVSPALAQERLSADAFEALTTGKTLHFKQFGRVFGAEQYYPNRRVVWAFEGDTCSLGLWYDGGDDRICFSYENSEQNQCWSFEKTASGRYLAHNLERANSAPLEVVEIADQAIDCPLPDVGS